MHCNVVVLVQPPTYGPIPKEGAARRRALTARAEEIAHAALLHDEHESIDGAGMLFRVPLPVAPGMADACGLSGVLVVADEFPRKGVWEVTFDDGSLIANAHLIEAAIAAHRDGWWAVVFDIHF